jgi:cobaltochelatase CobS
MLTEDETSFLGKPDRFVSASELFGFETGLSVPAFSKKTAFVPDFDSAYHFDRTTTLAVLAGFCHNKRVMLQGFHGTGKSSHIEQIAARLNWPCLRLNLDSHISRTDLVGRDAIILKEGKQVTEFKEGLLPWALQRPCALVFDEYDAGRPDVMFVIQRVLEVDGKLTLPEQNRVIYPHPFFRLFATANTVGLGDATGLYHGVQPINQGQMDRWSVVSRLNYLPHSEECKIILLKNPHLDHTEGHTLIANMVRLASLIRTAFSQGELSTVMSPRAVLAWAQNVDIFQGNIAFAFQVSFLNRCDEVEQTKIAELYQRCFGEDFEENPLIDLKNSV